MDDTTKKFVEEMTTGYAELMTQVKESMGYEEIEEEEIVETCSDMYEDYLDLCKNSTDKTEVMSKAIEALALIAFPAMLNSERNGWDLIQTLVEVVEAIPKKADEVKEQEA